MRHPATGDPTNRLDALPSPPWNVVVHGLRQAAGITQDGWAARLGYGRRTVQRWERGIQPPDASAATEIVTLCERLHLFRTYRAGSLAGVTIDADSLTAILAEARLAHPRTTRAAGRALAPPDDSHNLPAEVASLVGRTWEIDELGRVVNEVRLVTLTGTGGVGKTRLALRVARDVRPAFAGGAWLVELADVTDPALVPLVVAHALGVREVPGRGALESVLRSLESRRLLLVLDNCEQVGDAIAALVTEVLRECPGVHVLTTSRDRLGVAGEVVWPLAPLITPAEPPESTLETIAAADAVRLFLERARAARPEFELTPDNAHDVARICRRLDGLPLAIELAAARVSLLTPAEIVELLGDSRDLLATTGPRTPERHRTLVATLDWSWGLLTEDERDLLARLSVFVDGFGMEAIVAVCGRDGVLPRLGRLVDRSLVTARPDAAGRATRYRLLETVRAYAAGKLVEPEVRHETEGRLARWCVDRASTIGREIHGPDQAGAYAWVETEHGTIRSVMRRALEDGDAATALALIDPLWWPLGVLGHATEVRAWAEGALSLSVEGTVSRARIPTLLAAGALASFGGSLELAKLRLAEAESAARAIGDTRILVASLGQRARLLQVLGKFDEAARLADEALGLADEDHEGWFRSRMLEVRAHAALRAGDPTGARVALDEALRIARRAGDTWSIATVLAELGDLARSADRPADAERLYTETLTLRSSLGVPGSTPSLYQNLGFVAIATGDPSRATERFGRALSGFQVAGDIRGMAECAIGLAEVAVVSGSPVDAARLVGWAEASLQAIGAEVWPSTRADLDRTVVAARDVLGQRRWERERERGRALSLEEVMSLADGPGPSVASASRETRFPFSG